jgi:hypothetical protein
VASGGRLARQTLRARRAAGNESFLHPLRNRLSEFDLDCIAEGFGFAMATGKVHGVKILEDSSLVRHHESLVESRRQCSWLSGSLCFVWLLRLVHQDLAVGSADDSILLDPRIPLGMLLPVFTAPASPGADHVFDGAVPLLSNELRSLCCVFHRV